uniref:Uncharacterized protein n=1 Tax=Neovison vison TaxID=452646 RepID=A0A8C7AFC7_NEOVI
TGKSSISLEIKSIFDTQMLSQFQVKMKTSKKIPFDATGKKGDYICFQCLQITNKKKTQRSGTRIKVFERTSSFSSGSAFILEQLRQVNNKDPNRQSKENFDLLYINAHDSYVAVTKQMKRCFFTIINHQILIYLSDRKPESVSCHSKGMGGNKYIMHPNPDSITSKKQKSSQALNEKRETVRTTEEGTQIMKTSWQEFLESVHKLSADKHKC